MHPKSRNERNEYQNANRNTGYEERFGSAGQKGSHRYTDFEPETFAAPGGRSFHSDYSSFEGATNRPYYGGEEGSFPYGGMNTSEGRRSSYNGDERSASRNWRAAGEHSGKGPKGYRRSDARIQEEVSEMLMDNGDIDATEIEVTVNEGVVHLSGSVESRRIKRMAEDLVEQINGVRDVRNELQIVDPRTLGEMALPQENLQSSASSARGNQREQTSRNKKRPASSRQMNQ